MGCWQARTYHMEYDSGIWPPFRINERTVKPGDMTKQLSLPWQSDFGQCNTIWCVIPPTFTLIV